MRLLNYNKKSKKYKHITYSERTMIETWYNQDHKSKKEIAELLHKNPLELLNYLSEEVDEEIVTIYKKEIQALCEGKPLQYVIGNVNFYGLSFDLRGLSFFPAYKKL